LEYVIKDYEIGAIKEAEQAECVVSHNHSHLPNVNPFAIQIATLSSWSSISVHVTPLYFLEKWSSSPSPEPKPSTLVRGSHKRKKRKNIEA